MSAVVRCPNTECGHYSRISPDPPGRVFRCPRCWAKLRAGVLTPAALHDRFPSPTRQVLQSPFSVWSAISPTADPASESDDELDELLDLASDDSIALGETSWNDLPTLSEPESDSGFFPGDGTGRLGRYRILGVQGEGQYSRIYRGYDPVLERDVALKVVHPELLRSQTVRNRFLVEARALRDCDILGSCRSLRSADISTGISL